MGNEFRTAVLYQGVEIPIPVEAVPGILRQVAQAAHGHKTAVGSTVRWVVLKRSDGFTQRLLVGPGIPIAIVSNDPASGLDEFERLVPGEVV